MAVRLLKTLMILGIVTVGFPPYTAFAKSVETQAEMVRLQGDIGRLTQRNAWKGVERAYQAMLELGAELRVEDHLAGEQAARLRGDITAAYQRLKEAIGEREAGSDQTDLAIQDALVRMQSIDARYGRVSIQVQEGRIPALVRFNWPFAREERVSIELVRETLGKDKEYQGFLPIGQYMIDGDFFIVEPGITPQEFQIKRLEN
jgi:hypothetical protein